MKIHSITVEIAVEVTDPDELYLAAFTRLNIEGGPHTATEAEPMLGTRSAPDLGGCVAMMLDPGPNETPGYTVTETSTQLTGVRLFGHETREGTIVSAIEDRHWPPTPVIRETLARLEGKRLVILESPYAANGAFTVLEHVEYARMALRDCIVRGEAPIASHLLFTQEGVLNDDVPSERGVGIDCGLAWSLFADAAVFYVDRGWSRGMLAAKDYHLHIGTLVEERRIILEGPAS